MKKVVSLLICLGILLTLAVPAAANGQTQEAKPAYFRMDFDMLDDTHGTADFMVPGDRSGVYINAEDLAVLTGCYAFELSYQLAAFVDSQTQHAVMFYFDSKDVSSYLLGSTSTFQASIPAVFDGGVAWIPFHTAVQLLGCNYYIIADDHSACFVRTKTNTLTAMSALRYEDRYLTFDWCDEVGYDTLNYLIMSGSASTVNFFQGLLTGDTWAAILSSITSLTPLYATENANAIADCFVTSSQSEMDAFAATKDAMTVPVKAMGFDPGDIVDAKYIRGILEKLKFDKKTLDKVFNTFGKKIDVSLTHGAAVGQVVLMAVNMCSYWSKFQNSDRFAVDALYRYSQKTSFSEGRLLSEYASDLKGSQLGAFERYFDENGEKIFVEVGKFAVETVFESVLAGPAALALGWDLASSTVPLLKNTLDSTKAFSRSEAAVEYQNDALDFWQDSCAECFTPNGIKSGKVDGAVLDAYTYLKFSLVARGSAASCIESSTSLEDYVKDEVLGKMERMDARASTYINHLVDGDYGALLGDFEGDDTAIMELLLKYAEKIDGSSMANSPILDMSGAGSVTVEEAMELVAGTVSNLWSFVGDWGLEEIYTYTHVTNILADESIPCYVISANLDDYYSGNLYAVPYNGEAVWMVTVQSDGSYYCYTDIDMSRLTLTKLIDIIIEELMKLS